MPSTASLQFFTKLANKWIVDGKLVPKAHPLNPDAVKAWYGMFADEPNVARRDVAKCISENAKHFPFDKFIRDLFYAFSEFLRWHTTDKSNKDKQGYCIIASTADALGSVSKRAIKSNEWLALLLVKLGPALIADYQPPAFIITSKLYFSEFGHDKQYNYVILDDAMFSGSQMKMNLTKCSLLVAEYGGSEQMILNDRVSAIEKEIYWSQPDRSKYVDYSDVDVSMHPAYKPIAKRLEDIRQRRTISGKFHIVCAYVGSIALTVFDHTFPYRIWKKDELKTVRTLLKEQKYTGASKDYANAIDNMFSNPEGVPYIDNYPVYFDHKIPDLLSSLPTFFALGEYRLSDGTKGFVPGIVKGCEVPDRNIRMYTDLILAGSSLETCVQPSYKRPLETQDDVSNANVAPTVADLVEMYKHQAGGKNCNDKLIFNKKIHKVLMIGKNKYIQVEGNHIALSSIRGKYRYVHSEE